ncbi:hypothetical protein COLO4_15173 [Corchorus olitorius]|uniref:Uncharacterized protein n=1 Tax=Corchorus olitorius TaxID=93759 RepID=A0A1R3JPB2_9ROSI|nr:hypothetical protein COLO4_15173 [Corchorus olitorius]
MSFEHPGDAQAWARNAQAQALEAKARGMCLSHARLILEICPLIL